VKISLDYDGVLSHTMGTWCTLYNKKYNKNIGTKDIGGWDFYKGLGLTTDEAFEIFHECWANPQLLKSLEKDLPLKTMKLSTLGKLDIVTSVHEEYRNSIESWLEFKGVKYNDLIFSTKKYKLPYDVYIDDSPENALDIDEIDRFCLLYHQPWNYHIPETDHIKRIYSLDHAYEVLKN